VEHNHPWQQLWRCWHHLKWGHAKLRKRSFAAKFREGMHLTKFNAISIFGWICVLGCVFRKCVVPEGLAQEPPEIAKKYIKFGPYRLYKDFYHFGKLWDYLNSIGAPGFRDTYIPKRGAAAGGRCPRIWPGWLEAPPISQKLRQQCCLKNPRSKVWTLSTVQNI